MNDTVPGSFMWNFLMNDLLIAFTEDSCKVCADGADVKILVKARSRLEVVNSWNSRRGMRP